MITAEAKATFESLKAVLAAEGFETYIPKGLTFSSANYKLDHGSLPLILTVSLGLTRLEITVETTRPGYLHLFPRETAVLAAADFAILPAVIATVKPQFLAITE